MILYDSRINYSYNTRPTNQSLSPVGSLTDVVECKVTEELNGAYELRMVYVATGYNADKIKADRIIGADVPLRDQVGENYFRIYRVEKDITGRIYVYARHLASDLSYTAVRNNTQGSAGRITNFSTWETMLRTYAVSNFPFTFTFEGILPQGFVYRMGFTTVASVMQYIGGDNLVDPDKSMMEIFGGEIVWDKFNILRCDSRGAIRKKVIDYGVNMDSIAIADDLDGVYTSFILYYKDDEFNVASNVYSTSYASLFPYQRTQMIDWTFFLSDLESKTQSTILAALNAAADTYARNHNEAGNPVRVIDASMVEEGVNDVYLGDQIGVVYNRHGERVGEMMKIVGYEWDVLMQRYVTLTLGAIKNSLAKVIAETFTAQNAGEDLTTITQRISSLEGNFNNLPNVYAKKDGSGINANSFLTNLGATFGWKQLSLPNTTINAGRGGGYSGTPTGYVQSGWEPIGIYTLDWSGGGNDIALQAFNMTKTGINLYFINKGSANVTMTKLRVGIMYAKSICVKAL